MTTGVSGSVVGERLATMSVITLAPTPVRDLQDGSAVDAVLLVRAIERRQQARRRTVPAA